MINSVTGSSLSEYRDRDDQHDLRSETTTPGSSQAGIRSHPTPWNDFSAHDNSTPSRHPIADICPSPSYRNNKHVRITRIHLPTLIPPPIRLDIIIRKRIPLPIQITFVHNPRVMVRRITRVKRLGLRRVLARLADAAALEGSREPRDARCCTPGCRRSWAARRPRPR